jgi:hypothetical protein
MTIHSASRPIFGNQITELTGKALEPEARTVVVSSPPSNKARMVSGLDGAATVGPLNLALEELPLSFQILNDGVGSVQFRLMLMGVPDYEDGIEIYRPVSGPTSGTIDKFIHCIALVPGEYIEIEMLDPGGQAPTNVKITVSYKDFSREIVRVGRTLLTSKFEDIIPPPPVGKQNVPIANGDPGVTFGMGLRTVTPCFFTNIGPTTPGLDLQLKSDSMKIFRSNIGSVMSGQHPMSGINFVLNKGQSFQARLPPPQDDDDEVIAITTWLEISEPNT